MKSNILIHICTDVFGHCFEVVKKLIPSACIISEHSGGFPPRTVIACVISHRVYGKSVAWLAK